MAIEYTYAQVPAKLKDFLNTIRNVGVPDHATYKWLESLGYKSTNDRAMVRVLKFIGFADASGQPTEHWRHYRSANHRQVLAEAIKQGYQELFTVYPDAHQLDNTALGDFFSTRTEGGKQVISRLVRTFVNLCELADFESVQPVASTQVTPTAEEVPSSVPSMPVAPLQEGISIPKKVEPQIAFNIQVALPENASPETYDNIFKSIATHLLGRDRE